MANENLKGITVKVNGDLHAEVKKYIEDHGMTWSEYQSELPHRAISVYVYLSDRANKKGECFPAIPTIAGDLKLSESTVRRALHDLRKAGLITSKQRYRPNGAKSSLMYKIKTDNSS